MRALMFISAAAFVLALSLIPISLGCATGDLFSGKNTVWESVPLVVWALLVSSAIGWLATFLCTRQKGT